MRVGDMIVYYHHLSIGRRKDGYREAEVVKIESENNKKLTLTTGDYLPEDTCVQRIKILVKGKLEDHLGKYRNI